MLSPETRKRLAFVRYLYSLGVEQSRRPEPQSSASVLAFHDAVEFFLALGCEHLNVGKSSLTFMDYFETLGPAVTGLVVPQKESMRRLNKVRVAVKHQGTLPSQTDIETIRATATAFFLEATPVVFGVEWDAVSMIDVVASDVARDLLKRAATQRAAKDMLGAAESFAAAFERLIREYENSKMLSWETSPFMFGELFKYTRGSDFETQDYQLRDFVDKVSRTLSHMQDGMRILALGLDYRKYLRFWQITPEVAWLPNEKEHTVMAPQMPWEPLSEDGFAFCNDFVIECALILQQVDFGINGRDPIWRPSSAT